jgi:murein L,D-transpeptidase YcbB/YkuD
VLGEQTVKSLNVGPQIRAGQIAANLERYRWLPRMLGERYVIVNVPAFRLEGYEGGKKTIEMKVIVGAEYDERSTPVFSDTMQYVVFRPYWNVTDDIAANEILPKIASDPGYMARGNYEFFTSEGKRRVRQRPGDQNSLGLVKFMFPNDFNIYLHDTPNDELFKKDMRAFSHGCIRLERPAELAQWVLGWDAGRVNDAMHGKRNDWSVTLPRKVPVYITYFTAYERDGALYFGNDLYDRDSQLAQRLAQGALPDPSSVRAAATLRDIAESWTK